MSSSSPRPLSDRRATLAALLSFVFPGVGQAYNGQQGLAWILAGPAILLIALTAFAATAARSDLLVHLLDLRFLVGLIVLDGALLAWRLVAILQAHLHRADISPRRWSTYGLIAILALAMGMHVLPAYYAGKAIDTLAAVAKGGGGGGNSDVHQAFLEALPGVDFPRQSTAPSPGGRVTVLLVGVDWKPGRGEHLTDTMLVVSLDRATGQMSMISVPRDLYGARLPDGRTYNAKLNSLLIIASLDKKTYPLGGVETLKQTIGGMLGVHIDYFAAINIPGFRQAVDAIGGVTVKVTRAINDPTYRFDSGKTGFYLQPGTYHMDGELALAYVRSRKGVGDSDFTRAARQQQILTAIRAKLTAGNLLTALPGLLDAVKNTISTDVPSDQIPVLAQAIQDANTTNVERTVIQPPTYVTPATGPGGAYILVPNFKAILELGQKLMGGTGPASAAP